MSVPEFVCRYTMTLVEQNKMRPGYDCRCSGCMAFVQAYGYSLPYKVSVPR